MKSCEFIIEAERFPGVKTYSPSQIAAKHGVPVQQIITQMKMGMKSEMEHTGDEAVAMEIALDHLLEYPDYYTRLAKMER